MMSMNEFCAKKLGEVLAFEYIGKATFSRGKEALSTLFSQGIIEHVNATYDDFISRIEDIAQRKNVSDVTLPKKDKTLAKLSQMQELYVGDQWNNAIELSEWSGFYEGAAIVHWELVLGMSLKLKDNELEHLALIAIRFHNDSLKVFSDKLRENGMKRAE